MAVRRMGMLGVSVREMKLLAVKTERATVIGNWKYSESDMLRVLSV